MPINNCKNYFSSYYKISNSHKYVAAMHVLVFFAPLGYFTQAVFWLRLLWEGLSGCCNSDYT